MRPFQRCLQTVSSLASGVNNTGEGGKLGALWREELSDGTNLVQRKSYAYDELMRPMLKLMNHDGKWYYTTFRYDDWSRVQHTDWFWRPQSVVDSGDDLKYSRNRRIASISRSSSV